MGIFSILVVAVAQEIESTNLPVSASIPDSSSLHVEVSLGKILNPTLGPMDHQCVRMSRKALSERVNVAVV